MLKQQKLLLALIIFISPVTYAAQSFDAKVVKVIDGDTVQVLDDQNTNIRIRLYGIDAPESKQAYGQKSKQALSGAIVSKTVTIDNHGNDIYNRMLGTVWSEGYDINASMVASGYAWVYRYKGIATVSDYVKFENSAKEAGNGLWKDAQPVPPWDWRRANDKGKK